MSKASQLPLALRQLVKDSVAELGAVIRAELGTRAYTRIERLRVRMAALREHEQDGEVTHRALQAELRNLRRLSQQERREIAHAFSLMLELMNACESAYRSYRIRQTTEDSASPVPHDQTGSITFVLTAHPTEARSPANIQAFHQVQLVLIRALETSFERERRNLRHLLHLCWQLFIARTRRPSVQDEADHIYSIVLQEQTLLALLRMERSLAHVRVRSWVGGDKDGHPGVDETAMRQSLQLSRTKLLEFARRRTSKIRDALELISAPAPLWRAHRALERAMHAIVRVRPGDGGRVSRLRSALERLTRAYTEHVGELNPSLARLGKLTEVFPAWVVPLELRESSELILDAARNPRQPIARMLRSLARIARGASPRDYAAGLIISQFDKISHFDAALRVIARELGRGAALPVIPLFEQAESLRESTRIVGELLARRPLRDRILKLWGGQMEIMLGYSDSSKEMGAFPSRLAVSETMRALDRTIRSCGIQPIFFHGSGGSVDRGGGSIEEQVAAWPKSALEHYKATIQGEMVERTFASPEILRSQTLKILDRMAEARPKPVAHSPALDRFAARVQAAYQLQTRSPRFLEVVQRATTYRHLSALRIGSRPSARPGGAFTLSSLRAIPWVLCWTQTRVLFPAWWGVGSAWRESSPKERARLKREFARDPLFRSYIKLLGFTLRKVELPIWRIYLEQSGLSKERVLEVRQEFDAELERAVSCVRALSGSRDLLWFRPWLGESIHLRAPMIHPLNLLQILSMQPTRNGGGGRSGHGDLALFRAAATGISSGMLTTG